MSERAKCVWCVRRRRTRYISRDVDRRRRRQRCAMTARSRRQTWHRVSRARLFRIYWIYFDRSASPHWRSARARQSSVAAAERDRTNRDAWSARSAPSLDHWRCSMQGRCTARSFTRLWFLLFSSPPPSPTVKRYLTTFRLTSTTSLAFGLQVNRAFNNF